VAAPSFGNLFPHQEQFAVVFLPLNCLSVSLSLCLSLSLSLESSQQIHQRRQKAAKERYFGTDSDSTAWDSSKQAQVDSLQTIQVFNCFLRVEEGHDFV
jgi:hypothetical protein